jgi:hypothetical protein
MFEYHGWATLRGNRLRPPAGPHPEGAPQIS